MNSRIWIKTRARIWNRKGIRLHIPVSYTHLDVYKRQVPQQNAPQQNYGGGSFGMGDDGFMNIPEGLDAVSYTHLDVYKRQCRDW